MYVHTFIFFLYSIESVEFPTLTVCPDYFPAYKPGVLHKYGMTTKDIKNFNYPSNITKSISEIYHQSSHSIEELIEQIEISTIRKLNDSGANRFYLKFSSKVAESYLEGSAHFLAQIDHEYFWSVKNTTNFGQCYSMKTPKWILDLKVSKTQQTGSSQNQGELRLLRNDIKIQFVTIFRLLQSKLALKWVLMFTYIMMANSFKEILEQKLEWKRVRFNSLT